MEDQKERKPNELNVIAMVLLIAAIPIDWLARIICRIFGIDYKQKNETDLEA